MSKYERRIETSFSNNLKGIRRHREMTLQQLATASGLSKGFLSSIENGKANPTVITLIKLCECLEVTPNDLLAYYRVPTFQEAVDVVARHALERYGVKTRKSSRLKS